MLKLSSSLPPLAVHGNRITDAHTRRPVRLRGVNRSGLEYSSPEAPGALEKAGINALELDEIASWGANILRLPFNQEWALASENYDPAGYLNAIDQVISMAAQRGLYTLLDLQWLDATHPRGTLANGRSNFVPPLPNPASLEVWKQLAARHSSETAVLYDIFNEPHDRLPDDSGPFQRISPEGELSALKGRRVRAQEWHPWARRMVHSIRSQNPAALIFVSGLDWGYDLSDSPIADLDAVVYSSHVYPSKRKSWERAFGKLSRTHPVFVAEWGGGDAHVDWGRELVSYLDERSVGWAAWSWSDWPHLVRKDRPFEPTAFGSVVRGSLLDQASS